MATGARSLCVSESGLCTQHISYYGGEEASGKVRRLMAKQRATSKAYLDRAVKDMSAYLGAVDRASVRDQQRLYSRVSKHVDKISHETGMLAEDVWAQLEAEARRRGLRSPMPGRDYNARDEATRLQVRNGAF